MFTQFLFYQNLKCKIFTFHEKILYTNIFPIRKNIFEILLKLRNK